VNVRERSTLQRAQGGGPPPSPLLGLLSEPQSVDSQVSLATPAKVFNGEERHGEACVLL